MKARWWKWVVGLLVVGGVALAVGVMRLIEKPAPMSLAEVEAQQIAFFESLAPKGEAATTKLLEAWERMDAISAEWPGEARGRWEGLVRAFLDYPPMMPRHRPRAIELFETLGPSVDLLIEASFAPRLVDPKHIDDTTTVAMWTAGDLVAVRRVLLVGIQAAAERDDSVRVAACVQALLRFSRLRSQTPDRLGLLMGSLHIDSAIHEALRVAQEGRLSSEACLAIADSLLDDSLWHWRLSQHHVEAVRLSEQWEEASRRTELRERPALELADLRLRRTLVEPVGNDETDLAWLDWTCARSPDEVRRLIDAYCAKLAEWYTQPFETRSAPAPFIAGHPFEESQRELAQDVRATTDLLRSKLAAAALAMRLIAMWQEGGDLPDSLEELALPETVCPLTGRLFEYERRSPDARDPRPFVIRIPVTQAELTRVAPRMGRNLDHWVLVMPEPPQRAEHPSYGNEWLEPAERNE
jgi:hypothetical protein